MKRNIHSFLTILTVAFISNHAAGGILYFDPPDVTIGSGQSTAFSTFGNPATGGASVQYTLSLDAPNLGVPFISSGGDARFTGANDSVVGVPAGTLIDGSLGYVLGEGFFSGVDGNWSGADTVTAFIGLRFVLPGPPPQVSPGSIGGTPFFGWARVTRDNVNNTLTLHDYAFETSFTNLPANVSRGNPILAGAIPEPASLGVIGIGGVMMLRRSRRRVEEGSAGEPVVA